MGCCRLIKRSLWLCLLIGSVLLSTSATARPYDDVIESGEITIFVYSDFAPYSWEENGEYFGIDVAAAHFIADYLGVKLNLLMRGADENIDDDLRINIWKGDLIHRRAADVMLHVPIDKEVDARNDLAVINSPYFLEEMAVVVDKNTIADLQTFGYFTSEKIGAELDTVSDFFLSNAFRGLLLPNVRRGPTFADTIRLYENEEVAAVMASKAQAEYIAKRAENRDSYVVQPPMPGIVRRDWRVGIAIKHDSRDLGYAVGDALNEMIQSGRLAEVAAEYGVQYIEPAR